MSLFRPLALFLDWTVHHHMESVSLLSEFIERADGGP